MRRLKLSFLLALLMSMVGNKAWAYDTEIDGVRYTLLSEREVEITGLG